MDICSNGSLQGSWYQGGGKKCLILHMSLRHNQQDFLPNCEQKIRVKICGTFIFLQEIVCQNHFFSFSSDPKFLIR